MDKNVLEDKENFSSILHEIFGKHMYKAIWQVDRKSLKEFAMTMDNQFWKDVIISWVSLIEDPTEIDDILRVPIWNTYFVKNENIIWAKSKLQENGCIYVNDLRSEDGQFLTHDDFKRMYNMNRLNVLDYYSLIRCIPKEWKDVLSASNTRLENCEGNALLNEMNTTSKVCKMIYSKLIKI